MKTSTPTVTIVCPDWCAVDPQEHADELSNWEGRVGHQSEWAADFKIAGWTAPDGKPWPEEGEPPIGIFGDDRWHTLEEVQQLANDLLVMVATVRDDIAEREAL